MNGKKNSEGAITSEQNFDTIHSEIEAEIEGAVKMLVESDSTTGNKHDDTDVAKDTSADNPVPKGGDGDSEFTVGDAEIERAVKAGLSVSDARAFKDKDAFDRVCAALEKGRDGAPTTKTSENNADDEADGEEHPAEDDIPSLPDDKGFDEDLVKAFNKMGDMLKALRKENASLKKAGKTAEAQTFFDQQFSGIDEAVRSKIDDAGKAKLKQKFEILERGYGKNSGMTREEIFKEASEFALGSLLRDGKASAKAAEIERRKSLSLAQPSGANKTGTATRSQDDIDREVASIISNKFNI